jgi:hypothetical protein
MPKKKQPKHDPAAYFRRVLLFTLEECMSFMVGDKGPDTDEGDHFSEMIDAHLHILAMLLAAATKGDAKLLGELLEAASHFLFEQSAAKAKEGNELLAAHMAARGKQPLRPN